MNIAKLFRTPLLKKICERLLLKQVAILKNTSEQESAKLRAWRACVLAWFACLRACVLTCLACLRACVLMWLACLRAFVLGVLTCLACLVCLRVYVRTCYDEMFYFLTCLCT